MKTKLFKIYYPIINDKEKERFIHEHHEELSQQILELYGNEHYVIGLIDKDFFDKMEDPLLREQFFKDSLSIRAINVILLEYNKFFNRIWVLTFQALLLMSIFLLFCYYVCYHL